MTTDTVAQNVNGSDHGWMVIMKYIVLCPNLVL